ncbi:MAG: class I SAM-dependent methyltransferase [Acidobacteriota bacterium]
MNEATRNVHDFWNDASCGEELYLAEPNRDGYTAQMRKRYDLEPYLEPFARPEQASGLDVLEIGVGLGADHQLFAQAGAHLSGIDLTQRAVDHARRRLALFGLGSDLRVADAQSLPFGSDSFDIVYSWGVLHHAPDTPRAIEETWRVLRPGGHARVMIYHKRSLVGYMLWLRYALLAGRAGRSLSDIYGDHLESPGTKAYTIPEARQMFSRFSDVRISTVLTHGDLLESDAGQRHRGWLLSTAKRLWPRRLLRLLFSGHGLFMLIDATK